MEKSCLDFLYETYGKDKVRETVSVEKATIFAEIEEKLSI